MGRKLTSYSFPISPQLVSLTSTSNFFAAVLIRFHAASRSVSLTPLTWLKREIALRTWEAFSSGYLRSLGKAKAPLSRRLRSSVESLVMARTRSKGTRAKRTNPRPAAIEDRHASESWHLPDGSGSQLSLG